jgi:hypothetical protein
MSRINVSNHPKPNVLPDDRGPEVRPFVVKKTKNEAVIRAPQDRENPPRDGTIFNYFPSPDVVRQSIIIGGLIGIPFGLYRGFARTQTPAAVPQAIPVGPYHELTPQSSSKPHTYLIKNPFQPRSGW